MRTRKSKLTIVNPASLTSEDDRFRRYKILIVLVAIAVTIVLVGSYEVGLETTSITASFAANDIHYVNNGTIQISADITDTSKPNLVDVIASIDRMGDGVCSYEIATNQTLVCVFSYPFPGGLLSCSQLPETQNHVLSLNAHFTNSRGVIIPRGIVNTYSVTSSELGCPLISLSSLATVFVTQAGGGTLCRGFACGHFRVQATR
jgi:hypothetical protein